MSDDVIAAPTPEPLFFNGVMSMVALFASFRLTSSVVVIVTFPKSVVTMESTYLVAALAAVPEVFCSQPQVLAIGSAVLELVWKVSVMLVRHCEPAKMASDTLARTV